MRLYLRLARGVGVSVSLPVVLCLLPFLIVFWTAYLAALLVCAIGVGLVHGIEAIARAIERRHARRRGEPGATARPRGHG